ncbi:BamA/TamA family outer membrane protein [Candidatus Uabimicrobium sp. HlEnr_7]|uniref:BamA/TamA family outer membrane protein n=1 Tax=Candidatus Uabimicrobium helgolandensis TaxID=3095367 RepID=UPI0035577154
MKYILIFLFAFSVLYAQNQSEENKLLPEFTSQNPELLVPKENPFEFDIEQDSENFIEESDTLLQAAEDESFAVPLPIFSSNPNLGNTYGFLLAVISETNGHIDSIVAPLLVYNEFTGVFLDVNYFAFPTENIQYVLLFSHSTENFWTYLFEYQHNEFYCHDMQLKGQTIFERSPTERFHGIGADSEEDDETSFTLIKFEAFADLRKELWENIFGSIGLSFRALKPGDGVVDDVPSLEDLFPDEEGVDGSYTTSLKWSLSYDSRDNQITPTMGSYGRVFFEVGQEPILSSFSFRRYGMEGRTYLAFDDERKYLTVVRGLVQFVDGEDLPFYEQSSLGGSDTLRGYGDGRFYDNHLILLNIEERIRMYRWLISGISLDIETAIFTDIGQVANSISEIVSPNDIRFVFGVGVRFVVRSQIVAAVDIGYGDEGSAIFAGLDYPF